MRMDFFKNKKLAVVTPVKNEETNIELFYKEVNKYLNKNYLSDFDRDLSNLDFDIWYIDDGSDDATLSKIKELQSADPRVHFVSFSRNFGKESAIYAGLSTVKNYDFIVLMDVDLQDPPLLLPKMLIKLRDDDLDTVSTRRADRKGENPIISWFSNLFYTLISKISSTKIVRGSRDYRLMTKQVVKSILSVTENQRFSKGIFSWVGFKNEYISFENVERASGDTKWGFYKLFKYAITGMISFSTFPLTLVSFVGVFSTLLSIVGALFVLVRKLIDPSVAISGWTTLVIILIFFGGLQMFCLGIVGRYIASIFVETKNRPLFIIKEEK